MSGKGKRKSDKALRQGRKADSLSDPLKELGGYQQAQHLGDLVQHNEDALRQEEWIRQQKAAKLGVKPEDLDESVELAVTANRLGFTGSDRDEELIKQAKWDEDKLRDDVLGGKGLVISMAHIGKPGHRRWEDLEGAEWVSAMMAEKQLRATYVNASRQLIKDGPKPVQVILARVPPWVGFTAGPALLDQPRGLKERLVRICEEFSNRYNVDVIGAVVHRESDYDLHIHLVFSQTRERVRPKKLGARKMREEIKKVRDRIRADLRSQNKPATNQAVSAVFKQIEETGSLLRWLESVGTTESIRYERIKDPDEKVRRSTLGHAFLCKMQTWRAADTANKNAVAAFRDRPSDHPHFDRSFQERFAGAETRGQVLEDLWWNLWLSDRWQKLCLDGLGPDISEKTAELGRQAARDYLKFGSTVPTLAERLAVEKRRLEEQAGEQSERIAELKIELEGARKAAQVDLNRLTKTESKIEELEQERVSLADQLARSESEMERIRAALNPDAGESPASAAERLVTKTKAAPSEEVMKATQARLDELSAQADQMAEILKPAPEESLLSAATRTANQATHARAALTAATAREKENAQLKSELDKSQQTIRTLEEELGPLRKLTEAVAKFLEAVMAKGPKLGADLIAMLQELGELVGKKFQLKKKDDPGMPIN